MKKRIIYLALLTLCFNGIVNSQSTTFGLGPLGHSGTAVITDYCGWDAATTIPFNLEHRGIAPITMRTNGFERFRTWHRGIGFLLPGNFPLSQLNPYPGNRLTRTSISLDGQVPVTRPISALHIGYDWPQNLSTFGVQGGFRDWMNLGTMYMEGTDNFFVGLREKLTVAQDPTGRTSTITTVQSDDQDAVIAWGDNNSAPQFSPNNLTFIFTSTRTNASPNYQFTNYGREVARMTPDGFMGIGPSFFDNAQPRNLLHVNNDLTNSAYIQITNSVATGQSPTDGFQIGITAGPIATTGGIAEVRQYENRDMRFYTNNTQWMVIKDNLTGNIGRVGIRTNTPGNRLEVNSATGDPGAGNLTTPGGSSGIRTTNMTSASPAIPNPGLGVVSVDNNGDLIYVTAPPSGGGLGNTCNLLSNPLPSDWEIPLNNFNFRFQSVTSPTNINNVGIGTTCQPQAKLHVEQNSNTTNGSVGLFVENKDLSICGTNPVIGIKSLVSNINTPPNNDLKCAGWFEAVNSQNCGGSLINYGIIVPQGGGMVHIGYPPVNTANLGTFLLDVNGSVNASGIFNSSDVSLKNSVVTLPNSLNKIKNLRPVTFKWNNTNDNAMMGTHAGFIAQEVDTVIPQLVHTDANGKKTLAYIEMIPYLVSAIQEQQKQIKHQDSLIQVLTQNVASCCSNNNARQTGIQGNDPKALSQINVNLSDVDLIVLNQNVPNPFAEQTTITYNVPEKYGFAQLIFKTIDGKIIKTVDINKKGRGQVNVFANDLSNGLYMYTLIVDGMTIDTKKMVKQN
jgi:hypothetical protein